jgi:S1-C subfamily serine protease
MTPVLLLLSALSPQKEEESTLQKMEREVGAIVERIRPSVVQVTAIFSIDGRNAQETLTFSGVVYSKDGHIVTDASGIENATEVRITAGTKTVKGDLVASDRRTGVAVVHVALKNLPPAFLPEARPRAGAVAIVVGNPLGMRGGAVSGTVSGAGRAIQVSGRRYENMIQLNVPAQPGDCGGFVADSGGRLIGLLHSAYSPDPAEPGDPLLQIFKKNPKDVAPLAGQVVCFATPADWVRFSADRIIKHGRMVRGWLGLSARPVDPALRSQLGLEDGVGVDIFRVELEGPARAAGLAAKDILVEYDGKPVKDVESLQWAVAEVEEPKTVKVAYLRNRERRVADLRVELDPQK